MYELTYNHSFRYCKKAFKSFGLLADDLSNTFSSQIIDKVAQALEISDTYHNEFFEVKHYVGYFYKGESYSSLYSLAQKIVKEVDEEAKVNWFMDYVGVCARKDNGDEINLPWYDMFCDDYDHKAFDGYLVDEVDDAVTDEIKKALFEIAPEKGSFVFSFWESDFTIEVEEEDCFDMAVDEDEEEDDYEEEDD